MRVLNVVMSLDPVTGGGTAERTFQMSRFLARSGVQCTVLTLDIGLDEARVAALRPARLIALKCLWRRHYVPRLRWRTIRALVEEADVVHLMNHWTLINAVVYRACRRAGKPYVVCPAGALPVFGRSGPLKNLYNFAIGRAIIRNAAAWIAVTAAEAPQFERYGVPSSRITVIHNGVAEEDFPAGAAATFLQRYALPDSPTILFMGRLNVIKGPDLLLRAFAQIAYGFPHYHLVFAGPDEGMLPELREIAVRSRITDRVHFLGYVGGQDKSAAYRFAKLVVVPSRQEAMSIVALEAGICGTAALVTDQCGFGDVRLVDERLEVPATDVGIAEGLTRLLSDPQDLARLSSRWRSFVEERYSWTAIVRGYLALYRDVLEHRERRALEDAKRQRAAH